jgi:hypothetical protein
MLTGKIGLRVEVRARAPRPSPYRWEIYDGDAPLPIKHSEDNFRSEKAARVAGDATLAQMLEAHYDA